MIPYANMAPYEALGPPAGCYFVYSTPRKSIEALKKGAVWAAAVPVGGLTALEGVVAPIGLFGIAAYREVMSVIFFSDVPFKKFTASRSVRLSDESASSVRLLYLLLGYQNGFDAVPALTLPGLPPNGELLIGDAALRWLHIFETQGEVKGYTHVTDLADQWNRQHHLPFVFARWVVRVDAPDTVRLNLDQWLQTFAQNEPVLIEMSVDKVAAHLNLPKGYVRRYLTVIRRCLNEEDRKGQSHFLEDWQHYGAGRPNSWFPSDLNPVSHRTHTHG